MFLKKLITISQRTVNNGNLVTFFFLSFFDSTIRNVFSVKITSFLLLVIRKLGKFCRTNFKIFRFRSFRYLLFSNFRSHEMGFKAKMTHQWGLCQSFDGFSSWSYNILTKFPLCSGYGSSVGIAIFSELNSLATFWLKKSFARGHP